MKRNMLVALALIIVIAIIVMFMLKAEGHREDIGQLETVTKDDDAKYCHYLIESANPDAGYFAIGDLVCILCTEDWPNNMVNGNRFCWSRITFKSESGLVTYTAKTAPGTDKDCRACKNAKEYYKIP